MIKNVFDWTKEIMTSKRSWKTFTPEEQKSFEPFMVNRILSMNPSYIQLVNYVQKIPYSEKEKLYNIYCEIIPKKFIFSKYIKSSKKSVNKDILEKVSSFYDCSLGEAEEYVHLLRKEGVNDILVKSGVDEKTINKLLKELK